MILRPYQHRAIEALRSHYSGGRKRVLLVSPTGSGKTCIAAEIIRSARQRSTRVLFLAHRKELIDQTLAKLSESGIQAGAIKAGYAPDATAPVQVASIQTLVRRELPAADLLIVDEAHHASADTYRQVAAAYPRVLGLTATPWRIDGRGLADDFDAVTVAATPAELTEAGYLVRARCYAYAAPDLKGIAVRGGDYAKGMLELACDRQELLGAIVAEYAKHAAGRSAIVFPVSVAHSQHLVAEFTAAGYAAAHLDALTPSAERDLVLERFRSGSLTVLSSVGVLTEGFDAPRAEVCILARPTMSLALYMQMIGRVLRPFGGKAGALVHDHAGNAIRFGGPTEPRDYSLAASRTKQQRPLHMACPLCLAVIPVSAVTCPECGGLLREVASAPRRALEARVEGVERLDLEELRADRQRRGLRELSTQDLARIARCSRRRAAQEYLRLRELCASRGWSESTAERFYRQTFGTAPDFAPSELAGLLPARRPLVAPPVKKHAA